MQQNDVDAADQGHGDWMSHGNIDDGDSAGTANLDNDYAPEMNASPTSLSITDGMATLYVTTSSGGDS